jgi:DNA-binding transcriptional MerR regulator
VREYRIDELAQAAGMTVRNVRAYQDRGLLPRPRRQGRVGLYGDGHLVRLRLIGHLLDRGYSLANIGELMSAWERGHELSELLGLESAIASPWTDELPAYMTAEELLALFGTGVTPEQLDHAIALGIVQPEGDRFRVPSPRLLRAGAELIAAGVPVSAVLDHARQLRRDVDRIARRFVELVDTHIFASVSHDRRDLADLAELVRRLRPLGEMVVSSELAGAMERAANAQLGDRLTQLLEYPGSEQVV